MEPYDIAMLAVLVGATLFGAWKGMAWQIASLASLVLSYFLALRFADQVAPYFGQQAPWNKFLAMAAIYAGTSVAVWLFFRMVSDLIDRVKLQEWDRQIGALFGAAKGVMLCVAITFFAVTLSESGREHVLKSRSGHYISVLLDKAEPIMPPELKDVLGPYLKQLDDALDPIHDEPPQQARAWGDGRG